MAGAMPERAFVGKQLTAMAAAEALRRQIRLVCPDVGLSGSGGAVLSVYAVRFMDPQEATARTPA